MSLPSGRAKSLLLWTSVTTLSLGLMVGYGMPATASRLPHARPALPAAISRSSAAGATARLASELKSRGSCPVVGFARDRARRCHRVRVLRLPVVLRGSRLPGRRLHIRRPFVVGREEGRCHRRAGLVVSFLRVPFAQPRTATATSWCTAGVVVVPATGRPLPQNAEEAAIYFRQCPTSRFCMAVSFEDDFVEFNGSTWSTPAVGRHDGAVPRRLPLGRLLCGHSWATATSLRSKARRGLPRTSSKSRPKAGAFRPSRAPPLRFGRNQLFRRRLHLQWDFLVWP